MAVQPVQASYLTAVPIRAIGSLVIAPNGVARRMLTVCRNAFEDISGCLSESRPLDLQRDAYHMSVDRLALLGEKNSLIRGCICHRQFGAIRQDNAAGMAIDAQVDPLVWGAAWTHAKRLAGCIGRIFVARRSATRVQGSNPR